MEKLPFKHLVLAALFALALAPVTDSDRIAGDSADDPAPRFEAQVIDDEVAIGYGLAIGNVDGDDRPDILLADKTQFVWYRNGDWKRFVLAENLTQHDNVAIAARDVDGDGKVEVAVGARWNPGETSDAAESGSVHYLIRPDDPTQPWEAVALHHEPTVHRMRWVKTGADAYSLVVVPLHGRGNRGGEGEGVRILAYEMPDDPSAAWKMTRIDDAMHLTHNFEPLDAEANAGARLYIGGKEGVRLVAGRNGEWPEGRAEPLPGLDQPTGEVRIGRLGEGPSFVATVEPMHGNALAVYVGPNPQRQVLDETLGEGHALAAADLLGLGRDQIVVGWRRPNAEGKVGIKLFVPRDASGTEWTAYWIDEDAMACEDLQVADLDGDNRPDLVASGRATNNLKIYWNRTPR